jgi:hypothetical protein
MRVDLQSTKGAILLAVERIGSDDWLAYINGNTKRQGFLPECEGFFIEQCSWLPKEDFLWMLRQGARVCAYSARIKVPECVQNSKGSHAQIEGNHHNTNAEDKISYLLPKFQHP